MGPRSATSTSTRSPSSRWTRARARPGVIVTTRNPCVGQRRAMGARRRRRGGHARRHARGIRQRPARSAGEGPVAAGGARPGGGRRRGAREPPGRRHRQQGPLGAVDREGPVRRGEAGRLGAHAQGRDVCRAGQLAREPEGGGRGRRHVPGQRRIAPRARRSPDRGARLPATRSAATAVTARRSRRRCWSPIPGPACHGGPTASP